MVPGADFTSAAERGSPSLYRVTDAAQELVSPQASAHAQNALRRITTHETGEGIDLELDGLGRTNTVDDNYDEQERETNGDGGHGCPTTMVLDAQGQEVVEEAADFSGEDMDKTTLQDQTNLLPTKQVLMVFVGLTASIFCSLLDQTIVTTAIPTIGKVFGHADISSWVGTAYLLTSTVMQPIYGRLSDIFGRKIVLLGSLTLFLVGSLACAVAQSMIQLVIFRAIQGLGGGGILTLSLIIISDVVSLKDRGRYQGINGCVVALSTSLGPVLGGIFTEKATWRWCFYINIPLSVLAPLFIGLGILGLWAYIEARLVRIPVVPLSLLQDSNVAAAMVTMWFSGAAFYGTLYYLPTCYQVVQGVSAIRSGVLLLPLVLVQTVCSFTSGMLVSATGDYFWNLAVGYACWTIGLGLLTSTDQTTTTATLTGFQILVGFGAGQTFQTSLMAIQAAVDRKDMAVATGMRNFMRQFGGMVALAICSAIVGNVVRSRLRPILTADLIDQVIRDPTALSSMDLSIEQQSAVVVAYARAVSACFYFMTPRAGVSCILTVLFARRIPLERPDDQARKAEAREWVQSKKAGRHSRPAKA
ncbi:hypothetical protein JCM24511_07384 [Saitozyma sp. JCM 24511]|nr:hypothetical protein JCM24511_07384 [Saitozyma sp. JCM 24511]